MPTTDDLARLDAILRQIGDILFRAANTDAAGQPWARAYLDERAGATGGCALEKWRLVLATGQVLSELDVPRGIATLMTDAYDLRDERFADRKWYGVQLTVFPDGRQQVDFDYDPNCVSKGFFDS